MKDVLEFIVKSLVKNKDAVEVSEQTHGKNSNFVVKVDNKDLGSVIGRSGAVANAIRMVVSAVNQNHGRIGIKFAGN